MKFFIKKRVMAVTAFVLCILLAVPIMSVPALAAQTGPPDEKPISVEISPAPENANYNEIINFTVKTSKNVTRVKICLTNGTIYNLAFSDSLQYTDSEDVRTWVIPKRNQLINTKRGFNIYAGNEFGYSNVPFVIEGPQEPIKIPVEKVSLSKSSITLQIGEADTISATVTPENATNPDISWSSSNSAVASVSNGSISAISAGTAVITATADGKNASCTVTVRDPNSQTEPPYPFWKNYITYTNNEMVYYKGKIYRNKYWAQGDAYNPEAKAGAEWELIGDAEWTVPEDPKNYTVEGDPDLWPEIGVPKQLTDEQIAEKWGTINPDYSVEAALGRLEELLPESAYLELFPYRFGSENWKNLPKQYPGFSDAKYAGDFRQSRSDYYSYDNLKEAVRTLSNSMIMVQNIEGADYCTRITCFDKTTNSETVLYQQINWTDIWNIDKPKVTKIVDYGSFLADGSITDRKRELAAFLANCSHETGGGWLEGKIDEMITGLYWNEEINHIGATSSGYTDSAQPHNPNKSYHGRGPIQLSWNTNYSQFSSIVYGDPNVLLDEPERVADDGSLGFMAAIWFWMTPQPPKPSCHDVMISGNWIPTAKDISQGRSQEGFGMTIMIINGGLEGNCTEADGRVGRRIRYYRKYAGVMGVSIEGEKLDTAGMLSFYAT